MLGRALRAGRSTARPARRALASAAGGDARKRVDVALLFPGQGSQSVGMSADFIASFPVARRTVEEAEALLGRRIGDLMANGPIEALTETANSQLAIFVASTAVLRALREAEAELEVVACGGLSLGEYTALAAAGWARFEELLPVVRARGELMEAACRARPGAMAAVHGLPDGRVEELLAEGGPEAGVWAANFNCPGQVVVSGEAAAVAAFGLRAKAAGAKRIVPLKVAGAFHSGLMRPAAEGLAPLLRALPLAPPPGGPRLAMNVPGGFVADAAAARGFLLRQVTEPVRWEACARAIASTQPALFLEVGSGGVLAGLHARILPEAAARTLPLDRPGRLAELRALLQK